MPHEPVRVQITRLRASVKELLDLNSGDDVLSDDLCGRAGKLCNLISSLQLIVAGPKQATDETFMARGPGCGNRFMRKVHTMCVQETPNDPGEHEKVGKAITRSVTEFVIPILLLYAKHEGDKRKFIALLLELADAYEALSQPISDVGYGNPHLAHDMVVLVVRHLFPTDFGTRLIRRDLRMTAPKPVRLVFRVTLYDVDSNGIVDTSVFQRWAQGEPVAGCDQKPDMLLPMCKKYDFDGFMKVYMQSFERSKRAATFRTNSTQLLVALAATGSILSANESHRKILISPTKVQNRYMKQDVYSPVNLMTELDVMRRLTSLYHNLNDEKNAPPPQAFRAESASLPEFVGHLATAWSSGVEHLLALAQGPVNPRAVTCSDLQRAVKYFNVVDQMLGMAIEPSRPIEVAGHKLEYYVGVDIAVPFSKGGSARRFLIPAEALGLVHTFDPQVFGKVRRMVIVGQKGKPGPTAGGRAKSRIGVAPWNNNPSFSVVPLLHSVPMLHAALARAYSFYMMLGVTWTYGQRASKPVLSTTSAGEKRKVADAPSPDDVLKYVKVSSENGEVLWAPATTAHEAKKGESPEGMVSYRLRYDPAHTARALGVQELVTVVADRMGHVVGGSANTVQRYAANGFDVGYTSALETVKTNGLLPQLGIEASDLKVYMSQAEAMRELLTPKAYVGDAVRMSRDELQQLCDMVQVICGLRKRSARDVYMSSKDCTLQVPHEVNDTLSRATDGHEKLKRELYEYVLDRNRRPADARPAPPHVAPLLALQLPLPEFHHLVLYTAAREGGMFEQAWPAAQ